MTTERTRTKAQTSGGDAASPLVHIAWFVAGAVLGFLIPFIFTILLRLHHDFYYLIHFAITLAFLGTYIGATHVDLAGFFRSNWHWSLALGALAAAAVVFNVVSRGPTPVPAGPYLIFEAFWRGATYGVVEPYSSLPSRD